LEIVESIGAAGKPDSNRVKKYFRLEVNGNMGQTVPPQVEGRLTCFRKWIRKCEGQQLA